MSSSFRYDRSFFDQPCEVLAKALLGQILVRKSQDGSIIYRGRIVETECYLGGDDKASHSYMGKRTPRNQPMFMQPGTAYVYITYGMYYCFNISSRGDGAAVLLRGVEPMENIEAMKVNRQNKSKTKKAVSKVHHLCNGPAKLCIAFDVDKITCNGVDMCDKDSYLWIEPSDIPFLEHKLVTSSRIGIKSAGPEWANKLLRFYELGNSSVSVRDKKRETL